RPAGAPQRGGADREGGAGAGEGRLVPLGDERRARLPEEGEPRLRGGRDRAVLRAEAGGGREDELSADGSCHSSADFKSVRNQVGWLRAIKLLASPFIIQGAARNGELSIRVVHHDEAAWPD